MQLVDKQFLSEHKHKKERLQLEETRLEMLEEKYLAMKTADFDGMPHGSSATGSVQERLAIEKADSEALIEKLKKEIKQEQGMINRVLNMLPKDADPMERLTIKMRYIDAMDWTDILPELYGNRRDYADKEEAYKGRMFTNHRKALEHMKEVQDMLVWE